MSVKTITITEDAYTRLASRKQNGESFSELVCRIMPKRSLMELAGILNNKEADALEVAIKNNRKNTRARIDRIEKELI
ncbi:MAG: antitoxin VapB family protein [Candidatus Woesearchaeota archaeon]|nr:antitoxin VapB family protein [Candidatus Woesearchaeota archaeon]